jgi:hypothetical protein
MVFVTLQNAPPTRVVVDTKAVDIASPDDATLRSVIDAASKRFRGALLDAGGAAWRSASDGALVPLASDTALRAALRGAHGDGALVLRPAALVPAAAPPPPYSAVAPPPPPPPPPLAAAAGDDFDDTLVFWVNGQQLSLTNPSPTLTLAVYLRDEACDFEKKTCQI